ncbi:MAG: hypothetical protein JSW53_05910 [Candidatus Bathyarchaeota archaeon]|nr:MAG: hypothetical protein JSW53_05910 [Candidatus Bathyarchaeota archaeon]
MKAERGAASDKGVRGLLGFLIDVLSWLRIYRQRDFWVQIAAVAVGVLLWSIFEEVVGDIRVFVILGLLNFVMTNIVWAISRKPYSCVIGGSVGYGLYNLAVSAIEHHRSLTEVLLSSIIGVAYGFVFTWFAFAIFYLIGLIKRGKKREERKQPSTS